LTPLTDDEAHQVRQALLGLRASNILADRAADLLPDVEHIEQLARELVACFDHARQMTARATMERRRAEAQEALVAEEAAISAERPWAFVLTGARGHWHILTGADATAALADPFGRAHEVKALCGESGWRHGGWSLVSSFDGGHPAAGVCARCAALGAFPASITQ